MNRYQITKIGLTGVILLLLTATCYQPLNTPVYNNASLRAIDAQATGYLDDSFNKALLAFAAARATNAVLSLLQDSELSLPLVTIAVGEILDPLNDLVEHFSWVMLVSLTSIGVQKFLLNIGPWVAVKLLLPLSLGFFLLALWGQRGLRTYAAPVARRLLFVALFVRFCVPATAWVNAQTYQLFLDSDYQVAAGQVEQNAAQLKALQQELVVESEEDRGLWQRTKNAVSGAFSPAEWNKRFRKIEASASAMIESFLKLIVVFLLQTVLLPLLFLWGLVQLFKFLSGSPLLPKIEERIVAKLIGAHPPSANQAAKESSPLSPSGG
ncbi:MAG: hypothetical protein RQ724_07010 [Desulfuromonadales bacterium]|nr:hypothetical protein [Desulfuromonadales bacterium]